MTFRQNKATRAGRQEALSKAGENRRLSRLRSLLRTLDSYSRLDAALELARLGDFAGRETMIASLAGDDEGVAIKASEMLGHIGASWAVKPLAARISDVDSGVRSRVIFALIDVARPAVAPALIRALDDPDEERSEDARVGLFQVLGEKVPISEDGGDPEESQRIAEWWRRASAEFDPSLVYYRGRPAFLGEWIIAMKTASPAFLEWVGERLLWWTADRWAEWWKTNAPYYPPGQRFFYGHRVDGGTAVQ
jgi:HEAT repeat protein